MDWNAERTALRRIAALLLAFAALAERAGRSHRLVRCPALWILRRAESVACEFVTGEANAEIPASAQDCDAAEATRLALSFRALAAALDVLAARTAHVAPRRPQPETCNVPPDLHGLVRQVSQPDTS